ncbi:MAG: RNA polymerase sigma factor [Gemmatimonadaceae bacterium]
MADLADAELIAAVLGGNNDLYGHLVRRYQDAYRRFATRILGSADDADDALQLAFVRGFRALRQCREPARFAGWMFQIVVNECRTFSARRARRERRLVREDPKLEALASPSPETQSSEWELEDIQRALDRLEAEQREAFVLKHVEELSYEEMAQLTGAGVSALKMRVKRACERLRELLEKVPHE